MHRLLRKWTSVLPLPTPHTFSGSSVIEAPGDGDQGGEKKAEETDGSPPPTPSPSPGAWISARAQRSTENNGTPVPGSYGNRRGSCFFIAPFSSLFSLLCLPQTREGGVDLESNVPSAIEDICSGNHMRKRETVSGAENRQKNIIIEVKVSVL